MKESIDKIVQEGDWEFAKLLKLNDICHQLAIELYKDLTPADILELVWDSEYEEDKTIGLLINQYALRNLQQEFMTSFQKCFETATVQFNSPAKETLRVESIKEEQPPLPKPKANKSDKKKDTIKGEDGIDMPKGVKRL